MIAIIAVTEDGKEAAKIISSGLPGKTRVHFPRKGELKKLVGTIFEEDRFDGVIFIMALGIVVRLIAPHIKNKHLDPAVIAVDDKGTFAVSVLSGHEGGANKLAIDVGNILNAEPVVTTASEVGKRIIIGIGCRRDIKKEEIIKGIRYAVKKTKVSLKDVRYIATIDLKKDEGGLRKAALNLGIPLRFISWDMVKAFKGDYQRSSFVKERIGVEGVSEPCALLAARKTNLILPKTKLGGVTVAVAKAG